MTSCKTRGEIKCVLAAVLMAAAWAPHEALTQNYPTKAIRIVLPYLGGTDFVGRWIALKLSPALGQQVVVDPRPGAGGRIGHDLIAKAAPDGYSLMIAAPPLVINPHLGKANAIREYAPVALLGTIPYILAVHPSVPVKTLRELVQLARSNPGKLTYGSGAPGSTSHLAGELLKSLSKTNILLVPYKGASFGLIGAMSGEVDVVIPSASTAEPYVRDKRIRALAVLNTKPVSSMPDVPTAAQAGMPELVVVNWFVLTAPAGTPRAIIDRLNTEVMKVMQAADTQKQFLTFGGEIVPSTPEQTATFLSDEYERWGKVIRDANIKGE